MNLKKLLLMAQEEVIDAIQNRDIIYPILTEKTEFYTNELSKIWRDVNSISQENKFGQEDIFGTPLAVIYFLYCCPIQLMAVIQDKQMLHEYWDFFLDEFPDIKFDGNIQMFCVAVHNYKQ